MTGKIITIILIILLTFSCNSGVTPKVNQETFARFFIENRTNSNYLVVADCFDGTMEACGARKGEKNIIFSTIYDEELHIKSPMQVFTAFRYYKIEDDADYFTALVNQDRLELVYTESPVNEEVWEIELNEDSYAVDLKAVKILSDLGGE